ncbi:MAG: hypothetical protein HKP14_06985 [Bacteroidia bacterium]|nr:hypothetical protein [Bacteroidia bacterium]
MNSRNYDQVFIINRYSNAKSLEKEVKESSKKILIVSTHHLYKNEREEIQNQIVTPSIEFISYDSFNELIDDANLDEKAFQMSKRWIKYLSIYHSALKVNVIYLKNSFVYEQLKVNGYISKNSSITVFCTNYDLYNLGISYKFWNTTRSKIISTKAFSKLFLFRKKITYNSALKLLSYYLTAIFQTIKPVKMHKVSDTYKYYVMDKHRVTFKKNLNVKEVWFIPILIYFQKAFLATPIHSKAKVLTLYPFIKRSKTVLISDAFRPSTYPHFFALGYFGSQIIVKNKLDYSYFKKANLAVLPFDELIYNQRMPIDISPKKDRVNKVCLSLNHAVDFCSIISRCDTDKLIESVISIARRNPKIQFTIRLHPTSDLPQGEGLNWSERINNFVSFQKLDNLKLSANTLQKDWEESYIFLSEYSLSVIDSIVYDNFAIFVNLTNRKSFALDLKNSGFPEVNSEAQLEEKIKSIISNPEMALTELKNATSSFNKEFYTS